MSPPRTLLEKIWQSHVVHSAPGQPDLLYVDLHLIHEVTSPQAFAGLRAAGREVRRPDLCVATEGVLDGYVVMDVLERPERRQAMFEIAEPLEGPTVRRFRNLARALKTCLAFGFTRGRGRSLFNTAVFIDQDGKIRGTHDKVQFAEGCHPSWDFNCIGKKLRAFDTPFGRAGFLICNDRWNPDIARAIVLDGAQYLIICSYGSRTKAQNQAVLARARENGVPIVEANVGMNLIVSKGEVAAYQWGCDQITFGTIHVHHPPSPKAARAAERDYLAKQGPEMQRRYRKTMKQVRGARKAE